MVNHILISWSEIYVIQIEIVISIDSGISFCKITLIVQNPFSISVFTVKRCTLRSIDLLLSIASIWNLLFLVFLYSHTLNNSIYIWLFAFKATSEFSLGHAIFVIDQSLKLFFWSVCWKFLPTDHLQIGGLRSFQTQND